MSGIRWVLNRTQPSVCAAAAPCGVENAQRVRAWHASFPDYEATPLVRLDALAERLGVSSVLVKDESARFGLNAFKALGGSYAIGRLLAERLGEELSALPYARLTSEETRAKLGEITFVTATDGNHGRGVAWTAQRLGQRSVVYLPRGTARERLENIRALGSDAEITELSYDDAVRLAAARAAENGWVLVQDTAWDGYETVPGWIMEGYTTMGTEILEQLDGEKPTHIFLQAGVGAMAGAMAAFFADAWGEERPKIVVVEPEGADCLYRTAKAADGRLHAAGELHTIMAGLCCGEPCSLAWALLERCADAFVTIPDRAAARAMRILGAPLPGDRRIISGESGAAGLGAAAELLRGEDCAPLRSALGLDGSAVLLCISTEGDTDRENYRRIVWDGLYGYGGEQ